MLKSEQRGSVSNVRLQRNFHTINCQTLCKTIILLNFFILDVCLIHRKIVVLLKNEENEQYLF